MKTDTGEKKYIKKDDENLEYEEVEVWSEEWQCNIMGLVQKRDRSRSRSRDRGAGDERPTKASREHEGGS